MKDQQKKFYDEIILNAITLAKESKVEREECET